MHIYVTLVICAYTMTYTLCIQQLLLSDELLHSDICHLLISGVGVNFATDTLCESDGCYCKLPVAKMICDSRVSWTVYTWKVLHCMQVYWPSGFKCCFCYRFKDTPWSSVGFYLV